MKNRPNDPWTILRGRRGVAMLVAGALMVGLGVTGFHAAFAGGSSPQPTSPDPTFTLTPGRPTASSALGQPVPTKAPTKPTPTAEPTLDPNALADGVYPTYVRAVDVEGATITVDVLQTFFGADARRAAVQDGLSWGDVRYAPVYIRNENPLLRTLPVAADVKIELIGVCTDPDRWVGLTKLREATTPFTDTFYYDVTVAGGVVEGIEQLVAVAGC